MEIYKEKEKIFETERLDTILEHFISNLYSVAVNKRKDIKIKYNYNYSDYQKLEIKTEDYTEDYTEVYYNIPTTWEL